MTVPLCIRRGSKRNDDSVSVEELDWSAESQVLIPAEHLWCDFKCRPWAKNSSQNTNDLYIHYMVKSTGTPPSLEEKKALPNCGNKDEHIINVLKNCISTSVATVLKCMKWLYPCHWCLVMNLIDETLMNIISGFQEKKYKTPQTCTIWNSYTANWAE